MNQKFRRNNKQDYANTNINVDMNNIIEVACTVQMKQDEERTRQAKIAELERKSDQLML